MLNKIRFFWMRILANILLFVALYLCSMGVLKILSLFGATYGNAHSVAFAATLFAMFVLRLIIYRKNKKVKMQ